MKPAKPLESRHLGRALLAAAISAICVAFLVGCSYPYFSLLLHEGRLSSTPGTFNDAGPMTLMAFGLTTAMITLPVVAALTCAVAWPLFSLWLRRGYSGVAAYIGGGIIVAIAGAIAIGAAHVFASLLVNSDFGFALLLISIAGPVAGFVVWYVLQRSAHIAPGD